MSSPAASSTPDDRPDTPRSGPHRPDHSAEPAATTGSFLLPTLTGSIPVLEDPADAELAHRPTEDDYSHTRAKVTALVITVITTLSAIGPLATDMYIPAFPQVMRDIGTDSTWLQLTLTAFFVGMASGQVVAGPLSDRTGRRIPLIVGILLCLVGSIGCMIAPSIWVLLPMRLLQGLGGGFGMVLGRAVLIDLTDGPELFRVTNIMQGVGGIAPIVAPLLGGLVLLVGEWREVFGVIAAMSLISLIGVLWAIPESLPPERRHSGGFHQFLLNVRSLLGRRLFVTYLLVNGASAFTLMAYVASSSFVMQNMLGLSATTYSIFFALNSTGMMTMAFVSARLSGRVQPRTLIGVGLSVVSVAVIALVVGALFLGTPAWIVLPAFFLIVAPQGLIFGNGAAMASREALDLAGTGSAMLGLGFSFSASVAAPLVGIAGEATAVPMAICMVVGIVSALTAWVVAGRLRHTEAPAV